MLYKIEHAMVNWKQKFNFKSLFNFFFKLSKGSCTACVLTFDLEKSKLNIANVGDSGYRLLRNGSIVKKSEPQRITFDCPRQLDSYPWKAESRNLGVNYTEIL